MNKRGFIVIVVLAALALVGNMAMAGKFRNNHFAHPPKGEKTQGTTPDDPIRQHGTPVEKGKVSGTVVGEDGESMEGCKICFFDTTQGPAPGNESLWWRIPDQEYSGLVDAKGNFSAEVPMGDYVVASVGRRSAEEDFGPPTEGELVYLSDPVKVGSGEEISLGAGKSTRHSNKKLKDGKPKGMTRIEGIILDAEGNPFMGGFVIAYPHGYLSKRTKADGKFTLYLPQGGEYSLAARNVYGFT